MKRTQKALSLALILCMLLGMTLATALTAFAAAPTGKTTLTTDPETGYPKWSNDETVGWRNGSWYGSDSPFAYEYYVAPTATAISDDKVPSDATKTMGFYPMLWHESTGRFRATTTGTTGPFGLTDAQIGVLASSYHIAAAVSFTAPYTGKLRFTYECLIYANADGTNQSTDGILYISKSELNPSDASTYLVKETQEKATAHTDAAYGVKKTVEVDVTAGEKVYFTSKNNASALLMTVLYINSAEYIEMPVISDSAEVIGHSLSAMDTPVINFYVKLSETAVGSDAKIKVGLDEAVTVSGISAAGVVGPNGETLTEADHVRIYSVPVPAKRMTETVTISILGSDGQELLTSGNTYSVAEYCYAQVKIWKAAGDAVTRDQLDVAKICTGILVYGRTAQQYFGYNTANLPQLDADLLALVMADCQ
ncbi:MAG TPA: hypothetical protein DDW30_00655 [Clostridiales bacterium]|nr:hypothetical protein [Clostridiales bacterium]